MTIQAFVDPIHSPAQVSRAHAEAFYEYTKLRHAGNTRKAYAYGWRKFTLWLEEHNYALQPDASNMALLVGSFISDMAKSGTLKYRSIVAYYAAIQSYATDVYNIKLEHPGIEKALQGIRNNLKQAPVKKEAVKASHISEILAALDLSKLINVRDKALLLIGFSGAFRRSELVGIDLGHISFDSEGISIRIPHSKTDQAGEGQHVEIPSNGTSNCPVEALKAWIKAAGIKGGPIFRPISRHEHISEKRLTGHAIAEIVKKRAGGIFDNVFNVAGHSLRRGFVMSSIEADVHLVAIMNQTRHSSVNTLKEYASEKKNYKTNALHAIKI